MKMRTSKIFGNLFLSCAILFGLTLFAQPQPGVYTAVQQSESGTQHHILRLSSDYLIYTTYTSEPNHFMETFGGFFSMSEDVLKIQLEFHSNAADTIIRDMEWTYGYSEGNLIVNGNEALPYTMEPLLEQELDAAWLFATRGPDTGQERRGDDTPRKTLKFLQHGYFQWIAYNTETFEFFGTGGGRYAALEGNYIEMIQFFSRDDSRVGAELTFNYERKGNDWHHIGLNSRGEPLYEIWSIRE